LRYYQLQFSTTQAIKGKETTVRYGDQRVSGKNSQRFAALPYGSTPSPKDFCGIQGSLADNYWPKQQKQPGYRDSEG
jgi:hypothetical protein